MKKRILMLLLAACLTMNLLPFGAFAEEAEETTEVAETTEATEEAVDPDAKSGTCGDGLTWVLEGDTLTVSGSGEMKDGAPWASHKNRIKKLVLTGGVTRVGAESFNGYDRLEYINFGSALVEIGERAFYGCTELTVIHLPATFRTFGAECFRDCTALQKVYCDGGMPRFNSSCLWNGNYVEVYHPTNNVWPQDAVSQLVRNFGGRLGIVPGNYDASALGLPEETEAPTEAPTEPETEPATEPTAAQTEAAEVVYITAPSTEAPTEPQTQPTEAETLPAETEQAQEEPEDLGGKSWIGIVMIAGVITFLLAGTMIFRSATKKGGRYDR